MAARLELLEAEKELTRQSDELALRRQRLPWVRIEKEYRFDTDDGGPRSRICSAAVRSGWLAKSLQHDPLARVRQSALDVAKRRTPSAVLAGAVQQAASDDDKHVRYRATELLALWRKDHPELLATLHSLADNDPEPRIRELARAAL